MPDRLDRVEVIVRGSSAEIKWPVRQELVARLKPVADAAAVVAAFEAVGAATPVKLSDEQAGLVARELDVWWHEAKTHGLPDGVLNLRAVILDALAE